MSRFLSFCIGAILLMSAGCVEDINGKWKGQMEGPNGSMELIYTFKIVGDSLSGTVASPMGELPLLNGKKNDNSFSFDVAFNDMHFTNQCTVMGDSILVKMPGPGGESMELTLKRLTE
jgi:hypothetical protein